MAVRADGIVAVFALERCLAAGSSVIKIERVELV